MIQVYESLEKALRTGNGKLWLELHAQSALDETTDEWKRRIEENLPTQPDIRFHFSSVEVQTESAAVFGKMAREGEGSQFHAVRFVLENGSWKVLEEKLDEQRPIDQESFLPPQDGAFTLGGSSWSGVPYAEAPSGMTAIWAIQAVYDESFLHLRFEGGVALPTTGQEVADQFVPGIPIMPIVEIEVVPVQPGESPGNRFNVTIGDVTTQKPSFDETGKVTSTRYFMNYSLALQNSEGEPIFHNFADSLARLIEVDARFIEVKIPWGSLGMGEEDAGRVILHDRFGPLLPYEISRFP